MTSLSNKKRLDSLEVSLSPKEWAIRLADQMRSHPSELDFLQTIGKGTFEGSPIIHPFRALREQAEEQRPGENPGDIRNRIKLERALRTEYHALKTLIGTVNDAVRTMAEIAGIKAALKLTRLEIIVLRDAFARTAKSAVEIVQQYKSTGADEVEYRQGMIEELAAYSCEDSVPFPASFHLHYPSVIEHWVDEVISLAAGVWAHSAAVQAVQDEHFDGHPILYRDVEGRLDETITTLEEGMATLNAYLKTRADLMGELEGRLAIEVHTVRAAAVKLQTKPIVAAWIKHAKEIATADMLEETNEHGAFLWDRLRNEFGVNP